MRESIGATFLIKIMVIFIVLYNSLLAIAVNYAMVFRVKNQIINLLEQYEGCEGARDKIKDYIASVGYYRAATPTQGPYSIVPVAFGDKGTYYVVTTYIKFDFPVVREMFRVNVSGETKPIYGVYETATKCAFR
ncbi:MAG: hypothetical protein PHI22_04555 [Bacilli bacterium]|nr:hypothetical protein [Bacilli bacterium]MDD4298671.1 hypothetical protein [Bacilli bacterium]MDD4644122.1 hypothetical protein [Bacilli bacterium]